MKIYIIAARNDFKGDSWIVSAWDEYTIDESPNLFQEDLDKQRTVHSKCEIRVGIVEVPEDLFDKIFDAPLVKGTLVEEEKQNPA